MTIVGVNISDETAKRFKENRAGQHWDAYINRLLDSADLKMSEYELETLKILEEKKKRIEGKKR